MMKSLGYRWLWVWVLLLPGILSGQESHHFLNDFSPDGKLANSPINTTLQDQEGYFWIGTFSGLYRYDGQTLTHFIHDAGDPNSLLNNNVSKLAEDKYGQIWMSSESGLSCYNPSQNKFYSWLSINSRQLLQDRNGDILVMEPSGRYIEKITPAANQEDQIVRKRVLDLDLELSGSPGLQIVELREDLSGRWWLATNQGLWMKDTEGKLESIDPGMAVRRIAIGPDRKSMWVGYQGLKIAKWMIHPEKKPEKVVELQLSNVKRVEIQCMAIGAQNDLWVGTSNSGLFIVSPDPSGQYKTEILRADETRIGALPSNQVLALMHDADQNMWIGTSRGLKQVRQQPFILNHFKLQASEYVPLNQIISEVTEDSKGNLWIGTPNDGAFCRLNGESAFRKIPIQGNGCKVIVEISDGSMLLSMDHTCWHLAGPHTNKDIFQESNWQAYGPYDNPVREVIEVAPERIWLGHWRTGISILDLSSNDSFPSPLATQEAANSEFHVEVILKDRQGHIWIGTRGYGLYKLDAQGNILQFYKLEAREDEITYGVLSLKEDSRGRIWVGTRGGGVFCFAPNSDHHERYTTAHGLPSNTVCSIAEDVFGRIWLSTDNGIAHYLPEELIPFIEYGYGDGILNPHFVFNSGTTTSRGTIYFGSNNGFYEIRPISIPYQPDNPRIKVTQFQVFDGDEDQVQGAVSQGLDFSNSLGTGPVSLSFDQNSFDLKFTAMDFTAPQKIKYAYRLAGLEEEWTFKSSGNQQARYLNVPPGQYEFTLMCSDSKGLWTRQALTIPIEIQPSIWLTPTAYVIYAMLAILFIMAIVLLIKRWEQLSLRLRRASMERARQDSNMTYFSDLSHEIRNRLALIMGPLELVLASDNQEVPIETVQRIYQNALRLKRLTDEIMNLRKSEVGGFRLLAGRGDVLGFIKRVQNDMADVARLKQIQYDFDSPEEELLAWFDRQLVEIITLNLLGNALKYTSAGGNISIAIRPQQLNGTELPDWNLTPGEYIRCQISDTGKGIPPEDIDKIFDPFFQSEVSKGHAIEGSGLGLALVVRLIQLHHGAIVAQSKQNERTTITFWLPRTRNLYQSDELQLDPPASDEAVENPKLQSPQAAGHTSEDLPLVLVTDDDDELRGILREALEGEFRVLLASNGDEGYRLAQAHHPDLILSDMIMPVSDGLDFLKQIRADVSLNHIPFVVLTAKYSDSQRLASIQHDADDFLEKPFRIEFLRWRIRNLLHSRQLLREKYSRVITAEPKEVEVESPEDHFIQRVVDLMEDHISSSWLSVEFLASEMNMSRATFYRRMEDIMQDSPSNFVKQFRLKRAVQLLRQRKLNISEVSYQTGFKNPRYFSKCFQKEFGMSPSAYLKQMQGEESKAT